MASSGGRTGGAVAGGGPPRLYFCHECNRTVSISPSPAPDLVCPDCSGGFLEEVDVPDVSPMLNPFFPFDSFGGGSAGSSGGVSFGSGAGFPLVFTSSSAAGGGARGGGMDEFAALLGGASAFDDGNSSSSPDAFNPLIFLHNYFQTLRAGGANIQFVIDNNSGEGGSFRIPGNINLGDYFIGSNLEQLIQQLAENDPNRYGTPPRRSPQLMSFQSSRSPRNCSPQTIRSARYELPTDDPDYEQRNRGLQAQQDSDNRMQSDGSSDLSGAPVSGDNPQTMERRFRISLPFPWPFRAFGSPAETSDSGSGSDRKILIEELWRLSSWNEEASLAGEIQLQACQYSLI
ncbi:hypothetical protein NL676_022015 [Syzygium grande]|nr:hypothetical protein NL676_022015 [Syzygium grande]